MGRKKQFVERIIAVAMSVTAIFALMPLEANASDTFKAVMSNTISTNESLAVLLDTSGTLWIWGDYFGQSQIRNEDTYTPVRMMTNVISVSAGGRHAAAIKNDASLWTVGANTKGQLGDGTRTERKTPVKIMEDVATVSAGYGFTAAIKTDGTLWSWGENSYGQLGNGSLTDSNMPVKIMDDVAAVSAGTSHTAAIKKDGSLWIWGDNSSGQLGNGSTTDSNVPIKILDNVAAVSVGSGFTAIIKKDGSLWTWGRNLWGNLGNGTNNDLSTPTKVMENVTAVSIGYDITIAIRGDGSLWGWGNNEFGLLLDPNTYNANASNDFKIQTVPYKISSIKVKQPCETNIIPQYKVNFALSGGTGNSSANCGNNDLLTPPENPARDGYFFAGWFKDKACTEPWNFDSDRVTGNITIYAKWMPKTTATVIAEPSTQNILINGTQHTFNTYILRDAAGNSVNFVKLRDVAYILNGTAAQFNVDWRNNAIRLDAKQSYTTKNGSELTVPSVVSAPAKTSITPVLTNGISAPLEAFCLTDKNGGDHNYFKLRDIGKVAGFNVEWDSAQSVIIITTYSA